MVMWSQNWVGMKNSDCERCDSRKWILEITIHKKIWGDRKLRPTSATTDLSCFLNTSILMAIWSDMWSQNWVGMNSDYKRGGSRKWILEITIHTKIWGDRKLRLTSANLDLSRFWKSDQYWRRYGPIGSDKIESGLGLSHISSERTYSTDRWE